MPWVSEKQAAWGHSPSGEVALGGPEKVAEWDASTPKGSLQKEKIRWPGALGRAKKKTGITHAG